MTRTRRTLAFAAANLAAGTAVARAGDAIVVEGDPRPSVATGAVSVIPVDALGADADVGAAVDQAAGTTVLELGGIGDFSAVSLRGSSLRQVLVCLDGVPLNPDGAGVVDLSELPLRAFREVRVSRGAAPAALGGAPIGGVVDLITRDDDGLDLSGLAGSWRTARADLAVRGHDRLGDVPVDGMVLVDALGTAGDFRVYDDGGTPFYGLDDHDAPRRNNTAAQVAIHARGRIGPSTRRTAVTTSVFGRDEGLPGHANNPALAASMATRRGLVALTHDRGGAVWTGRIGAWGLARDERLRDPDAELGLGQGGLDMATDQAGVDAFLAYAGSERFTVTGTLTGRRDGYADSRGADVARVGGTALVTADAHGDAWHLSAAAQAGGVSTGAAWVAPRLGAAVRLGDAVVVRVQGGRGVRVPDFGELYGDRGTQKGNPDLRPERGWSADAGARLGGEVGALRGSVDLGAFVTDTTDLVVWVQNAQRVLVPLNLTATRTAGIEAEARGAWGPVDAAADVTWTRSENRSPDPATNGRQLPRVPTWEVGGNVGVTQGLVGLSGSLRYVDGQYWDATNRYRAPPRAFVDARARVDVTPAWTVELDVRNLLDRRVEVVPQNPANPDGPRVLQPVTDFVGWPLPGRTVLLGVRYAPESR